MDIYSLDTTSDVQNCYTTYQADPVGLLNCIRQVMNYPPVSPGTIPVVDANMIACLRAIFDRYSRGGVIDPTTGHMKLPYQTVINMMNEVRACFGLPSIKVPETISCVMGSCMAPGQTSQDITNCLKQCASQHQY